MSGDYVEDERRRIARQAITVHPHLRFEVPLMIGVALHGSTVKRYWHLAWGAFAGLADDRERAEEKRMGRA